MASRKEQTMKRINIILTDEDMQNIDKLKGILKDQTGLDYNMTQAIRYALKQTIEKVERR